MKNLFYDTECLENFFLASFYDEDENRWYDFSFFNTIDQTKLDDLKRFYTKHNKEEYCFIGYNSPKYDELVLWKLFQTPNITLKELRAYSTDIITTPDDLWYSKFRPHTTAKFADVQMLMEKFTSLKKHAARLKLPTLLESRVSLKDGTLVNKADIIDLINYCHNDVLLTKALYDSDEARGNLTARLKLQELFNIKPSKALTNTKASLAEQIVSQVLSKDNEIIIRAPSLDYYGKDVVDDKIKFETQAINEALQQIKNWHRKPLPPNRYDNNTDDSDEDSDDTTNSSAPAKDVHAAVVTFGTRDAKIALGGIHYGDKKNKIYFLGDKDNYILDVDVDSHYPSILANNGIGPNGIEDIFSGAVTSFISMRAEAKSKGDLVGSEVYKLLSNSVTGKLKQRSSSFYCPMASEKMVLFGQLTLLQLMERFHCAEFVMTQANTDGLSVIVSKDTRAKFDEILLAWNKEWNFGVKAKTYYKLIQRDMNNYCAVDDTGKVKVKGKFNCYPDKSSMTDYPAAMNAAISYLLYGTPIEDGIRSPDLLDFTRYTKRDDWVLAKDKTEDVPSLDLSPGFNTHGINRFYLAKGVDNDLRGFYLKRESLRKSVSVAQNVLPANNVDDINPKLIDYDRYISLAQEIVDEFKDIGVPLYSGNTVSKHIDTFIKGSGRKLKKADIDLYRLFLDENKIQGNVLDMCPNCSGEGSCKMQDIGTTKQHTYCFRCDHVGRLDFYTNAAPYGK